MLGSMPEPQHQDDIFLFQDAVKDQVRPQDQKARIGSSMKLRTPIRCHIKRKSGIEQPSAEAIRRPLIRAGFSNVCPDLFQVAPSGFCKLYLEVFHEATIRRISSALTLPSAR